jgi:hypothetical protein
MKSAKIELEVTSKDQNRIDIFIEELSENLKAINILGKINIAMEVQENLKEEQ